jgi:enterochelin esterase-like enzyme
MGDIAIIAPPVPNFFVERPQVSVEKYAEWIAGSMLAQLRERFPMLARQRSLTGIAGVSMGATLALRTGFRYSDLFSAVVAIEPALRGESLQIADDAKHTHRSQYIQLVMPERDEYLSEARRFSQGLRQGQVPHQFVVLPGDHGERFAAGAGSMEMLRFATSVLRRSRPL